MPDIDFMNPGKSSGDCIPIFHFEQREDQLASEEAGHPVYRDVPYVKIIAPGNDKEIVHRAVKEEDKERWPVEWQRFKNKEPIQYDGTPIEQWPQVNPAQSKTLIAMNIHTVEQLAEVADQNISNLGLGMMDLKQRAIAWVKWQAEESSVQKYAQQNRRLNEKIERLEEQIAALLEQVNSKEVAPEVAPAKKRTKRSSSAK